jgi:hypothetical protein
MRFEQKSLQQDNGFELRRLVIHVDQEFMPRPRAQSISNRAASRVASRSSRCLYGTVRG